VTEPTTNPTAAELDRAILDAARALTAALRARPRDQAATDAARQELDDLRALKLDLYPNG
jgi:hypothetical protein